MNPRKMEFGIWDCIFCVMEAPIGQYFQLECWPFCGQWFVGVGEIVLLSVFFPFVSYSAMLFFCVITICI